MLKNYKVCTTVKPDKLELLLQNHPDKKVVHSLVNGFKFSFSLGYHGPRREIFSDNQGSAKAHLQMLEQKVFKEVALGRVLGPFSQRPMKSLTISPISLVPKAGGGLDEFHLVFNLSWPPGDGVNDYIPEAESFVHYKRFDHALQLVRTHGTGIWMAKLDLDSAFRHIPMNKESLHCLGFCVGFYFIDAALSFGDLSSCKIFEQVATAFAVKDFLTMNQMNTINQFFL